MTAKSRRLGVRTWQNDGSSMHPSLELAGRSRCGEIWSQAKKRFRAIAMPTLHETCYQWDLSGVAMFHSQQTPRRSLPGSVGGASLSVRAVRC